MWETPFWAMKSEAWTPLACSGRRPANSQNAESSSAVTPSFNVTLWSLKRAKVFPTELGSWLTVPMSLPLATTLPPSRE